MNLFNGQSIRWVDPTPVEAAIISILQGMDFVISAGSPRCGEDISAGSPRCGEDISAGSPRCSEDISAGSPRCGVG